MKITSVSVRPVEKEDSKMKGIASITIDDCFVIHDIRIIEKEDGALFVAMPSRKTANGSYRDVAHPIKQELRQAFESAILEAYKTEIKG